MKDTDHKGEAKGKGSKRIRSARKLELKREELRTLSEDALAQVHGGLASGGVSRNEGNC